MCSLSGDWPAASTLAALTLVAAPPRSRCSYRPKFRALEAEILGRVGDKDVKIEGAASKTTTGEFEVTVSVDGPRSFARGHADAAIDVQVNGRLVHSKLNGDGKVDNEDKLDYILEAVEECVEAAKKAKGS